MDPHHPSVSGVDPEREARGGDAVVVAGLRSWSGERRFCSALAASQRLRELALAGIRLRRPELDPRRQRLELLALTAGRGLAGTVEQLLRDG